MHNISCVNEIISTRLSALGFGSREVGGDTIAQRKGNELMRQEIMRVLAKAVRTET